MTTLLGVTTHPAPPLSAASALPASGPGTATRALRTFIVEDSAIILDNLAASLEDLTPVQVVGDAPDEIGAIRRLGELGSGLDLVIIDVFLKSGSGLGVLRAAGALAAKRVVLTNYATQDMRQRCRELGADRVFDKSNELDDLITYCMELGGELTG